jgi:dimethylargininase
MLRNEGDRLTKVVVCTPQMEYFQVDDLQGQNINEVADREKTIAQHGQLKTLLEKHGCEVIDASELPGHPNSVFTRDVALCTPEGYVKLRMGLMARRGEEDWMANILDSLGEPCVGEIIAPGTVEGGDVILAGSVAFVGESQRTNEEGIRQLAEILNKMDIEVRTVPVMENYLHLGGAMSALGPKRVLCCAEVFPEVFFEGYDVIEAPHQNFMPSVGNVICLAANEVIANSTENMAAINIMESKGVTVHQLDLSEFRKGAGGPTCMILPVERK